MFQMGEPASEQVVAFNRDNVGEKAASTLSPLKRRKYSSTSQLPYTPKMQVNVPPTSNSAPIVVNPQLIYSPVTSPKASLTTSLISGSPPVSGIPIPQITLPSTYLPQSIPVPVPVNYSPYSPLSTMPPLSPPAMTCTLTTKNPALNMQSYCFPPASTTKGKPQTKSKSQKNKPVPMETQTYNYNLISCSPPFMASNPIPTPNHASLNTPYNFMQRATEEFANSPQSRREIDNCNKSLMMLRAPVLSSPDTGEKAKYMYELEGDGRHHKLPSSPPHVPRKINRPVFLTNEDFPEAQGKYELIDKIGAGSYSVVYKAKPLPTNPIIGVIPDKFVALKRITTLSSPARISNEVQHLVNLGGHANVVKLYEGLRHKDQITLVMEYIEYIPFKESIYSYTVEDVRLYLRHIFESLSFIHSKNVIHRDVKPGNCLFSLKTKRFLLIDFGLAEMYIPDGNDSRKPARAGTRGFRAPEVLMGVHRQTVSIDVWSAGVILLILLCQKYPFFYSPDDLTGLVEIAAVFGSDNLIATGQILGKHVVLPRQTIKVDLEDMCARLSNGYSRQFPREAFDLLSRSLDINPFSRATAAELVHHPFLLNPNAL